MRALIAIEGQSNCQGVGVASSASVMSGSGAPTRDPIAPQGGYATRWPTVANLAAARGSWLTIRNHARGATALTDVWVGRCRAYSAGMVVLHGSYVLSGGNVYKAVGAIGTAYTLNVAPSSGVGTSGLTSWTNLGAATAGDTDGAVYDQGSARFDPNGLHGAIYNDIGSAPGYDKKAVLLSFGQTDKTVNSTRAQISAAMQAVAAYFTTRGIHVFLGTSCYDAESGADAYYSASYMPGRSDALASLASNPLVHAGADLRTALGTSIGMIDSYHMTPDQQIAAAVVDDAALSAAGF